MSWLLVRHFVVILNFKMNLKQVALVAWLLFPNLFSTSLVMAMLKPNCAGLVDNPGTTSGAKLSVLQKMVFPSLVNRGL